MTPEKLVETARALDLRLFTTNPRAAILKAVMVEEAIALAEAEAFSAPTKEFEVEQLIKQPKIQAEQDLRIWLRNYRHSFSSGTELAAEIGIKRHTLEAFLRGHTQAQPRTLQKISNFKKHHTNDDQKKP